MKNNKKGIVICLVLGLLLTTVTSYTIATSEKEEIKDISLQDVGPIQPFEAMAIESIYIMPPMFHKMENQRFNVSIILRNTGDSVIHYPAARVYAETDSLLFPRWELGALYSGLQSLQPGESVTLNGTYSSKHAFRWVHAFKESSKGINITIEAYSRGVGIKHDERSYSSRMWNNRFTWPYHQPNVFAYDLYAEEITNLNKTFNTTLKVVNLGDIPTRGLNITFSWAPNSDGQINPRDIHLLTSYRNYAILLPGETRSITVPLKIDRFYTNETTGYINLIGEVSDFSWDPTSYDYAHELIPYNLNNTNKTS